MTIGGAFILGGVAGGFFNQIGADTWELFKEKLKLLFRNKKTGEKEKLLSFEFTTEKDGNIMNVEIILMNPKDEDLENFLETGLKSFDTILPKYFNSEIGLKKIVMEYSDNSIKVNFGIRKDAVPIFPKE